MTGNVTFYLTMQWALSCSHCYSEVSYLLLWEDGIACSWLQMFATHNVRVIPFVISSFMSLEFDILTSTLYTDFE